MIASRPEINNAIRIMIDEHIENLSLDKIGSFFTFLVKANYYNRNLSEEDMKKVLRSVKKNILHMANFLKESEELKTS